MPTAALYAVVGDVNIRRNMTAMNVASRVNMASAKLIDCSTASSLVQALKTVPDNTSVCVVQCISSILASVQDTGSIFGTIDPILADFAGVLREFCSSRVDLQVTVAPPLYRLTPVWYRRHLPEIVQQFSSILSTNRPRNLHLLSSSVCQDLTDDGFSLTPIAGLHYLIHLFDESEALVKAIGAKGKPRLIVTFDWVQFYYNDKCLLITH